ncbi:hypothetical protein V8E54_012131 [Elaphomyces granulatus]
MTQYKAGDYPSPVSWPSSMAPMMNPSQQLSQPQSQPHPLAAQFQPGMSTQSFNPYGPNYFPAMNMPQQQPYGFDGGCYSSNRDFSAFAEITMRDSNSFHATCLDSWPPIFYMNDISRAAVRLVHDTSSKTVLPYAAMYEMDLKDKGSEKDSSNQLYDELRKVCQNTLSATKQARVDLQTQTVIFFMMLL